MGTGRSGSNTGAVKGNTGKRVHAAYKGDIDPTSDEFKNRYLRDANPKRDAWLNKNDYKAMLRMRREYRENCQRVAYVTDLRLAGYDVEAMRRGNGQIDAGFFREYATSNSFYNIYENAQWKDLQSVSAMSMYNKIHGLLPNNGDRAIITVAWKGGGAHATNVVNYNGQLYVVDGQVNKVSELLTKLKQVDTGRVHFLYTGNGIVREYKTTNSELSKYVFKRRKNQK